MREELANLCHEQWADWMKYMFSKGIETDDGQFLLPEEFVKRWQRQMNTPYSNLSESEQNSDRSEADKFMAKLGIPT